MDKTCSAINEREDVISVEDWGGGGSELLKNHLNPRKKCTLLKPSELATRVSSVDGIYMRHVLERNRRQWRQIVSNLLQSFEKVAVIILSVPWSNSDTEEQEFVGKFEVALPKPVLLGLFYAAAQAALLTNVRLSWSVSEENKETVIVLQKEVQRPKAVKVLFIPTTGFGDRISCYLMFAAAGAALGVEEVHVLWDCVRRPWGKECLHGDWPSVFATIRQHVTFPSILKWTAPDDLKSLPLTELKQGSKMIESVLPTSGWKLFYQCPGLPPIASQQVFCDAYRKVAKELIFHHPVVSRLPKEPFAVVHVRGGDKRGDSILIANFIKSTNDIVNALAPLYKHWILVSDDQELCEHIPALAVCAPSPLLAKAGLDATLRDLTILVNASVIVQHSPNGWSAFSHIAACIKDVPIINTYPHDHRQNWMNKFFTNKTTPHYFFQSNQLSTLISLLKKKT
jgi:hypothetical protein